MIFLGGSIVNLSSFAGIVGPSELTSYSVAKGGIRLLSKSVASHCIKKKYAIRCNSIHPGYISTQMEFFRSEMDLKDDMWTEYAVSKSNMGKASDFTSLILFLLSDESKHINGLELAVRPPKPVASVSV